MNSASRVYRSINSRASPTRTFASNHHKSDAHNLFTTKGGGTHHTQTHTIDSNFSIHIHSHQSVFEKSQEDPVIRHVFTLHNNTIEVAYDVVLCFTGSEDIVIETPHDEHSM
jgi:hypothetical protein